MSIRQAPPGLKSSSQRVVVAPSTPHHSATYLGSVQTLNTRSRGASNTRVNPNSRLGAWSFARVIELSLFDTPQHALDVVEAGLPQATISSKPLIHFSQGHELKTAWTPLSIAPPRHQPSPL